MKKLVLTELQKEVKKQVQRINRLVRKYNKEGFKNVSEEVKFDKKNASTRTLERLKKIGREKLLKKSTYSGPETGGKEVKPKELTKIRREQTRKENKSDKNSQKRKTVNKEKKETIGDYSGIYSLISRIEELPTIRYFYRRGRGQSRLDLSTDKSILVDSLYDILNQDIDSVMEYEKYIEEHSNEIEQFCSIWTHDSDEGNVRMAVSRLLAIIVKRPLSKEEQEEIYDEYGEDDDDIELDLYNISNIV